MKLEILRRKADSVATSAPPILFLHGSYSSAAIWAEKFMPFFGEQGFDCYAMSLRGHGASEGVLTWATLADYVEDLVEVTTEIGQPAILVGHSMGGLVVQHFISQHAAKAAVLLATVPPSGLSSSAMHMSMVAPDVLWQLGLLQCLGPDAVSPGIIARALFSREVPPERMSEVLTMLQRESNRVAAELLAPMQPEPPHGPTAPPVYVLGGDADLFLPISAFREAATYFKGELEIMEHAPHGLMLDEDWWKPTAERIMAWLERRALTPVRHAEPTIRPKTKGTPRLGG